MTTGHHSPWEWEKGSGQWAMGIPYSLLVPASGAQNPAVPLRRPMTKAAKRNEHGAPVR